MKHRIAVIGCLALLASACVTVEPGKIERTVDGLDRIQSKTGVDVVFTAPGMSLAPYRRVMLDPVEVGFKLNWKQAHPEITADELTRLRTDTATLFREAFSRELQDKGGYALTDQPAPDVLRVSASVVGLDVSSPGSASSARTYVISPTEMTLLAELRDSESGAILVRAADMQRGRQSGNLQIADEMMRSEEAQRAFATWADLLRNALDAAKAPLPAQAGK